MLQRPVQAEVNLVLGSSCILVSSPVILTQANAWMPPTFCSKSCPSLKARHRSELSDGERMPKCFAGAGPVCLASCRIKLLQAYVLQTNRFSTLKLSSVCVCIYEKLTFF